MKKCTMMGLFFAALSLTINAQTIKSSGNSQTGQQGVENQYPPSIAAKISKSLDGPTNSKIYNTNRGDITTGHMMQTKPSIQSSHTTSPKETNLSHAVSSSGAETGNNAMRPMGTKSVSGSIPVFFPRPNYDQEIGANIAMELSDGTSERSNLGCSQENPTNGFEIGFLTSKDNTQLIATDITVAADTDFTLNTITVNIHSSPGESLISADISFYENAGDIPGLLKSSQLTVIPISQTVIGSNNGYDISEVVFNVNPVLLQGQAGISTTYWVSLYAEMTSSTDGFIDGTSMSIVGNSLAYSSDAGASWFSYSPYDVVYSFDGDCTPLGGGSVSCSEENPNDFTFQDGYMCSSDYIYKTANDITVAADTDFTLENITLSLFTHGDVENVNVNYYDNDGGLPGALIGSESSVTINSQTIIGSNIGYDIREVKVTVNPFTFSGQAGVPTTYWIELSIRGAGGEYVYWVITSSSMIGNPVALYDSSWQYPNTLQDGVYVWEGTCSTLGDTVCAAPTDLMVSSITETTADISWTSGGSETDWIVQYGITGFDPNTQGTTVAVSGTPNTTLSTLIAGTDYDVYVKADCGSTQSDFTGPLSFTTTSIPSTTYFITTWKTTMDNENITIPTTGSGYSYSVDWGDGSTDTGLTGNATHSYAAAGIYTVKINGSFPRIFFNNGGDAMKLMSIEQWGDNMWTSMNGAFAGAQNMVSNATDMPDLSMVTDMYGMFSYARKFNGDANFGNWDVSNVTNMYGMFAGGSIFNFPIGSWDVGNVTDMENMFYGATIFNQDLSAWNVGNVTNMDSMFRTALYFNQDLSGWNVGSATTMQYMFAFAIRFDQNLGNWNVTNVTKMNAMFKGVKLSTSNYDSLLNGWSGLSLKNNVKFSGGNSNYCDGETARQLMVANFNWNITDGGLDCGLATKGNNQDMGSSDTLVGLILYPNPVKDMLILSNTNGIKLENASVYDLSGRLVQTTDLSGMSSEIDLDMSKLSSSTYMVIITGEKGQVSKLIIRE